MDDVRDRRKYQETGQEKRPARMVGLQSLDCISLSMEAEATVDILLGDRGGSS
jgi:hypothetical protein